MKCCDKYQLYLIRDRHTGQVVRTACQKCVKEVDKSKYLIDLKEEV